MCIRDRDEKEAAKEAKAKEPVEVKKADVFICLLYTSSGWLFAK